MTYENALNIYVDGSSYSNPRRGGIGIRYVTINEQGDEVIEDCVLPGHKEATNNEMELLACIEALEGARSHEKIDFVERVCIFTDSMYVTENVSRAMFQWSRQKWLNREGRPIDSANLWKDLVRLLRKVPKRVDFEWVKGHSKNAHNKAVDKLAKQSAIGLLEPPLKVASVRRKRSPQTVRRGSVPMCGQTLEIHIITDTYLRVQKVYKYKYEVLTGEYRGNVDWIYAAESLRAGHHYEVLVNNETNNPRILIVVREMERS